MTSQPTFCFLVRHRPCYSVVVHARVLEDGKLELLRLTPDAGVLPDFSSLIGTVHADRRQLREAVLRLLTKKFETATHE